MSSIKSRSDSPGASSLERDADAVLLVDNSTTEKGVHGGRFSWTPLGTASIIVINKQPRQPAVEIPVALTTDPPTVQDLFSTTCTTPHIIPDALILRDSNGSRATLPVDMSPRTNNSALSFLLGADNNNKPVWEDFESVHHLAVISNGIGSSRKKLHFILDTIILSILMRTTQDEIRLVLMDYSCPSLSEYSNVPHLLMPPITEEHLAQVILEQCANEVERRLNAIAKTSCIGTQASPKLPRLLIVIGELVDLLIIANEKSVTESIIKIARHGHEVGVHIIVGTCFADSPLSSLSLSAESILAAIPFRIYCMRKSNTLLKGFIDIPDLRELSDITHEEVLVSSDSSQSNRIRRIRVYNIDKDETLRTIPCLREKSDSGHIGIPGRKASR